MKRLLIPVANIRSARRVIDHLVLRLASDKDLMACLLHVEEPISQWSALRGQHAWYDKGNRVDALFDQLFAILRQKRIEHSAYVRTGGIVFTILDTAEELDCHEIVMPAPATGIRQLWSRGIVWHTIRKQRKIPVVVTE